MILAVFSVRFLLESGKMCKNTPTFFIFTLFLQIFPVFSPGRDQLLGRAGQGNISPPHEFWIAGLDRSI